MVLFPLPTGMVVLFVISIASAAIAHWRIRNFWVACLLAGLSATALFALVSYFQAGIPTSFELRPVLYFTGFGLLIAVATGLLVKAARLATARGA